MQRSLTIGRSACKINKFLIFDYWRISLLVYLPPPPTQPLWFYCLRLSFWAWLPQSRTYGGENTHDAGKFRMCGKLKRLLYSRGAFFYLAGVSGKEWVWRVLFRYFSPALGPASVSLWPSKGEKESWKRGREEKTASSSFPISPLWQSHSLTFF